MDNGYDINNIKKIICYRVVSATVSNITHTYNLYYV